MKRGETRRSDIPHPQLFNATVEEIFKRAKLENGIVIEREGMTNLIFADDVTLFTENSAQMEHQLNATQEESKM